MGLYQVLCVYIMVSSLVIFYCIFEYVSKWVSTFYAFSWTLPSVHFCSISKYNIFYFTLFIFIIPLKPVGFLMKDRKVVYLDGRRWRGKMKTMLYYLIMESIFIKWKLIKHAYKYDKKINIYISKTWLPNIKISVLIIFFGLNIWTFKVELLFFIPSVLFS